LQGARTKDEGACKVGLCFLSVAKAAHLCGSFRRRRRLRIHNQQLKIKTPQTKLGLQAGLLIKGPGE